MKPNKDDCLEELMRLVDNCNIPNKDDDYNPSNVKAGGSRRVGIFTYRIEPVEEQPYNHKNIVMGRCWCYTIPASGLPYAGSRVGAWR